MSALIAAVLSRYGTAPADRSGQETPLSVSSCGGAADTWTAGTAAAGDDLLAACDLDDELTPAPASARRRLALLPIARHFTSHALVAQHLQPTTKHH